MGRIAFPAISLFLAVILAQEASAGMTYTNPVIKSGADPGILTHDGIYYLYTTGFGIPVYSSEDLVNWKSRGFALKGGKAGKRKYWAPEVIEKDGKFLMHYSAELPGLGHRIFAGVSDSPLGPFTDEAKPMFDLGTAFIDAHVFIDTDGKAYLFASRDISQNPTSSIYAVPLKDNLVELDGEPKFCIGPNGAWEGRKWNEAPFVVKHKQTYYLMYSAGFFGSENYAIGYATAESPLGPWKKYAGNPILSKTSEVAGPGHHCVTKSPDASETFIVYHSLKNPGHNYKRQIHMDRLRFVSSGNGPDVMQVVDGPSLSPRPVPSQTKKGHGETP